MRCNSARRGLRRGKEANERGNPSSLSIHSINGYDSIFDNYCLTWCEWSSTSSFSRCLGYFFTRLGGYSVIKIHAVLILVLVMACCSVVSVAQSDLGTVTGFVKDPSGATIANAKVTIRNNRGVEREATSNDSGYFTITNVPPGLYTLVAEAQGFQRYETKDNKLDPSATLVIDVALAVGSASETVRVSASAVQLQTESASVQQVATREQIDSLEINGRNPIFMANLVPGTRGGTLANLAFNFTQGPSNINGARTPETLITYDGAPAVRTRSNGTSIGAADVDSTQEIQILTAAPLEVRSVSHPRAARRTSTARSTNTSATPFSMQTRGSGMRSRRRRA
jgi:hypothetical protein